MQRSGWIAVLTACLVASPQAGADVPRDGAVPGELVATRAASGLTLMRQLIEPGGPQGPAGSRIIYLNRTGIVVTPGLNDARLDRSSLADQRSVIPPWDTPTSTWQETVGCVEQLFAPFAATVVDEDPGDVPHIEAVIGGSPLDLGLRAGIGGISPFRADCSVIENAIVFVFAEALPETPRVMCEVIAQEVAHSFGLDHELLAADPMTYLQPTGPRAFQDQLAACGEWEPRPCGLAAVPCRAKQNSVAMLRERLGAPDPAAPMVSITSPVDGATVRSEFEVAATSANVRGGTQATLYIDRVVASSLPGAGPYRFRVSALPGPHTLTIEVTEGARSTRKNVRVVVEPADDVGVGCRSGRAVGMPLGLVLLSSALLALTRRRARSR